MTSFEIEFDDAITPMLDELLSALPKVTRPAAQAGAQVLYDEARLRVPSGAVGHWFYGSASAAAVKGQKRDKAYWFDAGALRRAIYQKHVPEESNEIQQVYHISWRKTGPDAVPYGYMVEFGTSRAPAHPFLRPAFDAKSQAALQAADKVLGEKLDEVLHGA